MTESLANSATATNMGEVDRSSGSINRLLIDQVLDMAKDDLTERVIALFEAGASNREISDQTGLDIGKVRGRRSRWVKKNRQTPDSVGLVQGKKSAELIDQPDELAKFRKRRSQAQKVEAHVVDPGGNAGGEKSAEVSPLTAVFSELAPGEALNMPQVKRLITAAIGQSGSNAELMGGISVYLRALQVEQALPTEEDHADDFKLTAEEAADRMLRMLNIA